MSLLSYTATGTIDFHGAIISNKESYLADRSLHAHQDTKHDTCNKLVILITEYRIPYLSEDIRAYMVVIKLLLHQ